MSEQTSNSEWAEGTVSEHDCVSPTLKRSIGRFWLTWISLPRGRGHRFGVRDR